MSDKTSTETSEKLKEKPDAAKKEVEGTSQSKKSAEVKSVGGLGKLFNAETSTGRANVAKATYAAVFLTYLYFKFVKGKKPPPDKPGVHVSHDHMVGSHDKVESQEHNVGSHDHKVASPDHKVGSPDHKVKSHARKIKSQDHGSHDHKVHHEVKSHEHHELRSHDHHEVGAHDHSEVKLHDPVLTLTTAAVNSDKNAVPKNKTETKLSNEMPEVAKILPKSNINTTNKRNEIEIINVVSYLKKYKRKVCLNPKSMDP